MASNPREFKFRVFLPKHHTGVGDIVMNERMEYCDKFGKVHQATHSNFMDEVKRPFYIMQFTGLLDKDGKEIYEGDIVERDDDSKGKYWRVAVVKYMPDICFEIIKNTRHPISIEEGYIFRYGSFSYKNTDQYLSVVGNIYETPELLGTS